MVMSDVPTCPDCGSICFKAEYYQCQVCGWSIVEDLRRQLTEALEDLDGGKGDLNEIARARGISLLHTGLRGKIAGLVMAMDGQHQEALATLTARYEALREAVEYVLIPCANGLCGLCDVCEQRLRSAIADAPEALGRRHEAVEEPHKGSTEGDG